MRSIANGSSLMAVTVLRLLRGSRPAILDYTGLFLGDTCTESGRTSASRPGGDDVRDLPEPGSDPRRRLPDGLGRCGRRRAPRASGVCQRVLHGAVPRDPGGIRAIHPYGAAI